MTDVQIYAGTLTASETERSATGLLVPFGEECSSNLGKFKVDTGAFAIPKDLTGIGLNIEHEREKVAGAVSALASTDQGIVATFAFADTDEGNQALADARSGKRRNLSVEVSDVVIRAGKAVAGRIFGAAVVKAGAFPSATLLAAATDTIVPPEVPVTPAPGEAETSSEWPKVTVEKTSASVKAADGTEETQTTTKTTKVEEDGTTTVTTVVVTEPAEASAPNQEGDPTVTVPNTLTASKAATTIPRPAYDINTIAAAIAELRSNPAAPEARTLLASLSDITMTGSGALPVSGVLQTNWLGLLDQGDTYERQYVTLGNLGTDITAAGKKGFTIHRGTSGSPIDSYAPSGDWAGNKASIFSGVGHTATKTSVLDRFAIGEDIGREFYDLPGGAEAIIAFLALLDEDHKVWSDNKALGYWQSAAGAPVAASASIPTDYTGALGMLIQGIIGIKKRKADGRRDTPTFAILNDMAYEAMLYTPFEKIPEFIKFSANTDGTGLADGDVVLVNGDTGIVDTASVMVGARKAIQFDELAGGPLHVDALNIANGGIDKAVHGYLQTFITRPEAVSTIGVADTRANSTGYAAGRLIKASAVVYRVVVAGATASSAPTAPAVGATVADGTATLLRLA